MYTAQAPQRGLAAHAPTPVLLDTRSVTQVESEDEFHELLERLDRTGGAWTADEVAARLQDSTAIGIGRVARSIVDRKLVNIFWNGTYWLPAFQYALPTLEVRTSVSAILLELTPVMNDWSIVWWFSSPNQWLGNASPADLITTAPAEVFHSARAQRFLVKGL